MTYEEVNRIFRTKFLGTCCIDLENDEGIYECESPTLTCEKCRIAEAERMILEAIEKQTPKKPIDRRKENYPSGMFKWFHCSCCDAELRTGREAYCEWCGQKFDLSEVK